MNASTCSKSASSQSLNSPLLSSARQAESAVKQPLQFARRGARVTLSARSGEALSNLADQIRKFGGTAIPHLTRAGGGALIHISSGEARRALPLQAPYAASKHGVKGLVDALRIELRNRQVPISVTNIMPSSINTPLLIN